MTVIFRPYETNYNELSLYPNSGYAHEKVNETTPDGDTTYIYTNQSNYPKAYFSIFSGSYSGTINYVNIYVVAKKTSSSYTGRITYGFVDAEGYEAGENINSVGTVYQSYYNTYLANPFTLEQWNWNDLFSLRIFVKAYSSSTLGQTRITQVYVEVDYTPSQSFNIDIGSSTLYGIDINQKLNLVVEQKKIDNIFIELYQKNIFKISDVSISVIPFTLFGLYKKDYLPVVINDTFYDFSISKTLNYRANILEKRFDSLSNFFFSERENFILVLTKKATDEELEEIKENIFSQNIVNLKVYGVEFKAIPLEFKVEKLDKISKYKKLSINFLIYKEVL